MLEKKPDHGAVVSLVGAGAGAGGGLGGDEGASTGFSGLSTNELSGLAGW